MNTRTEFPTHTVVVAHVLVVLLIVMGAVDKMSVVYLGMLAGVSWASGNALGLWITSRHQSKPSTYVNTRTVREVIARQGEPLTEEEIAAVEDCVEDVLDYLTGRGWKRASPVAVDATVALACDIVTGRLQIPVIRKP